MIATSTKYPLAGGTVDGMTVLNDIPNTSSISSSLGDEYLVLKGIREVPLSDFDSAPKDLFYAADDMKRVRELAAELESSKAVKPLIVVVGEPEGPYILEGGHRLGALHTIGKKSFPALVVDVDMKDEASAMKVASMFLTGTEETLYAYLERKDEEMSKAITNIVRNKPPQPWVPMDMSRLTKIWQDYAKHKIVRDERGLDAILDNFLGKVARLDAYTELAGHTSVSPESIFEENEVPWKPEYDDRIDREIKAGTGTWVISDYGLKPLQRLILRAIGESDTEEKLLALDSILNVVHQRSDLASLFVKGGRGALTQLSEWDGREEPMQREAAGGRKLYIDLNGVLLDLAGALNTIGGSRDTHEQIEEFWRKVNDAPLDVWIDATKIAPEGMRLWNAMKKYNPIILSSVGVGRRWSENRNKLIKMKDAIVQHHFPGAKLETVYGRDKSQYATGGNALIDDSADKVKMWDNAGGVGYLWDYKNAAPIIGRVKGLMDYDAARPRPLGTDTAKSASVVRLYMESRG